MQNETSFPDDFYKYDTMNYRRFLQGYVEDLRTSYNRSFRTILEKLSFKHKIIFVGSSWSLNAARIFGDYVRGKINFYYAETYEESVSISKDDLVIAISYSGNSEEASSWLKHARRVGAKTLVISASDKLVSDSLNSPIIDLTKNIPSRCSVFSILGTLLRLFEDAGLIESQVERVQEAVDFLRTQNVSKIGEDLSLKLYGVIPLIYSSSSIKNSCHRFKRLINVNAKTTAFFNVLPGADFYEAEGFVNKNASFHAIFMSGSDDLSRLKKKISMYKDSLQSQGVNVTEISIKGKNLVKIVTVLMMADYTSYYLALRYKQEPLSDLITSKIKKDMGIFI